MNTHLERAKSREKKLQRRLNRKNIRELCRLIEEAEDPELEGTLIDFKNIENAKRVLNESSLL